MLFAPSPKRRRVQLRISERRLLIMFGDAMAVVAAVLVALVIWSRVARADFSPLFVVEQSYWFFILLVLWLTLAGANDFYELPVAANRLQSFQKLVGITGQLLIVYLIVFFLSPRDALPRLFIFYYGISSFILIGIWRFLNPALIGWASEPRRIMIIGTDWGARAIIEAIAGQTEHTYIICGIIGETADVGQMIAGVPVVGVSSDLMNFVRRDGISELVLTSTHGLSGEMFQAVMDAYEKGIELVPMTLLYERITGRVPVEYVESNWTLVLPIDGDSIFYPYPVLKRFAEVVLSLFGLVGLAALLVPLAVLIKLDSPGGVFYTQERVGLNGRVFRVYKFRTMRADAEAMTGAVFSQKDDPRVTRVGRFMRKTRLDEVPQLINVLRGDMSLIGPRPERPEHVKRLTEKIPFYRTRLVIRPGLTGWAQVRYGYGSTDEDAQVKLEYDLYYIRHQTLWLDLNILVRTVGKVVKMSGI